MYVKGMYVWGNIHTYLETRGMYVCQRYVYLGKRTYLENDRYVCMYVWGPIHTYLETRGMYVCQRYVSLGKHTYLEHDRYVCMSA